MNGRCAASPIDLQANLQHFAAQYARKLPAICLQFALKLRAIAAQFPFIFEQIALNLLRKSRQIAQQFAGKCGAFRCAHAPYSQQIAAQFARSLRSLCAPQGPPRPGRPCGLRPPGLRPVSYLVGLWAGRARGLRPCSLLRSCACYSLGSCSLPRS